MASDPDLSRFHVAQAGTIDAAIAELRAGRKTGHWMWFVFPQIAGLGSSAMARTYAIRDLAEARAYLADPVLRQRLEAATRALLGWSGRRSATAILGGIDAMKLRSSLTLFEAAAGRGTAPYADAIDALCGGVRDLATLARL